MFVRAAIVWSLREIVARSNLNLFHSSAAFAFRVRNFGLGSGVQCSRGVRTHPPIDRIHCNALVRSWNRRSCWLRGPFSISCIGAALHRETACSIHSEHTFSHAIAGTHLDTPLTLTLTHTRHCFRKRNWVLSISISQFYLFPSAATTSCKNAKMDFIFFDSYSYSCQWQRQRYAREWSECVRNETDFFFFYFRIELCYNDSIYVLCAASTAASGSSQLNFMLIVICVHNHHHHHRRERKRETRTGAAHTHWPIKHNFQAHVKWTEHNHFVIRFECAKRNRIREKENVNRVAAKWERCNLYTYSFFVRE